MTSRHLFHCDVDFQVIASVMFQKLQHDYLGGRGGKGGGKKRGAGEEEYICTSYYVTVNAYLQQNSLNFSGEASFFSPSFHIE